MQKVKLGLEINVFEVILHRCLPEMSRITHLVWEEKVRAVEGERDSWLVPVQCGEAWKPTGGIVTLKKSRFQFQLSYSGSSSVIQAKVILPVELTPCGICRMDNMLSQSKPSQSCVQRCNVENCRYSGKDCGCRGDPYPPSMHAEGSLCRIGSGLLFHLTYLGIMQF